MDDTKNRQEFGERLKAALNYAGVTGPLRVKAKVLGVSVSMAGFMEVGRKLPSMKTATRIADTLGVRVEWLMTGQGPMRRMSEDEAEILTLFSKLDPRSVERVKDFVEGLLAAKHNSEK